MSRSGRWVREGRNGMNLTRMEDEARWEVTMKGLEDAMTSRIGKLPVRTNLNDTRLGRDRTDVGVLYGN